MVVRMPEGCPPESHLERHESELDALSSISTLLATRAGQEEMLADVLRELEGKLHMHRSTVMLLSLDGGELVVEASRDIHPRDRRTLRYRRGEGVTGNVLQTGQPAVVPQISQEPRFANRVHQREQDATRNASFICVPIMVGREVVGTLSADLPSQPLAALEEQARVLQIVASLIAFDVKTRRLAESI